MAKIMIKKLSVGILLVICLWSISGSVVLAEGLVNCGTGSGTADNPSALDCNFVKAIEMINTIINYLIMIAMPLAAIAFAYAGWLYLSSGDNPGKVTDAKKIFLDVGIGVIIVLSGWLVFKLIATTFLDPDNGYGTYLN
jgi:hypothetical protein